MSEQQNATLIQQALEAFGRGDVEAILNSCASDCEFYCPGPPFVAYTGVKKGRKEIEGYFSDLIGTQTDSKLTVEQLISQGDTVVVIGRYSAKIKSTGKLLDSPLVLVFHIKDGKIARHMVLGDTFALGVSYTESSAAGR
jgi:hypothetical protein